MDGNVSLQITIPGLDDQFTLLNERIDQLMATEAEINQRITDLSSQIDTATTDLRSDIDTIKQAVAAGVEPNWAPLDQRVAALQALAAENPPA